MSTIPANWRSRTRSANQRDKTTSGLFAGSSSRTGSSHKVAPSPVVKQAHNTEMAEIGTTQLCGSRRYWTGISWKRQLHFGLRSGLQEEHGLPQRPEIELSQRR